MVLTDLPFERGRLLHNRYTLIRRPGSAPPGSKSDEETDAQPQSKEYAAFLKEQDRKVGPDGFLDSGRFAHTYELKKERKQGRATSDTGRPTVVFLTAKTEKDKKDHEKRIKVIEDHMWQHKQEERELKRMEGDIQKKQRAVKNTVKEYEHGINKKRAAEEKKLSTGMEKYTKLQKEHLHKKEESTKSRIQHSRSVDQHLHDQGRKSQVKASDLARTYRTKMSELELRRIEVMRISQDFENKMRAKEEEQFRLKRELADLAISLNMEAQKGRVQKFDANKNKRKDTTHKIQDDLNEEKTVQNKLMKSDGDTKGAEMSKRKLSADLQLSKAHMAIKMRDEQRHLTDTQIRIDDNSNTQRQLNEAAFHADMDLKARQIEQRLEAHNARRANQLHHSMKQKKDTEEAKQAIWEARFKKRYTDQQLREHEDSLKFFQKMVSKETETEQNLYGKVRNAEYARQKQEQSVRRLQQNLNDVKRLNASKMREDIAERHRTEKEMQQQLIREKAKLDKVHSEREESYIKLQQHRHLLKTDKHNLEEHEREHNRLMHIGSRTDTYLSDTY